MISGPWFQRKYIRIGKNCTKLHIIKYSDSTLILNKSGRRPPKKHSHQICNKSMHQFKR